MTRAHAPRQVSVYAYPHARACDSTGPHNFLTVMLATRKEGRGNTVEVLPPPRSGEHAFALFGRGQADKTRGVSGVVSGNGNQFSSPLADRAPGTFTGSGFVGFDFDGRPEPLAVCRKTLLIIC